MTDTFDEPQITDDLQLLQELQNLQEMHEEKKKLSKAKVLRTVFYGFAFAFLTLVLNSGYMLPDLNSQIIFNIIMVFLAVLFFNMWSIVKFVKCKRENISFKSLVKDEPFKQILGVPVIFIIMTSVALFISLLLVFLI